MVAAVRAAPALADKPPGLAMLEVAAAAGEDRLSDAETASSTAAPNSSLSSASSAGSLPRCSSLSRLSFDCSPSAALAAAALFAATRADGVAAAPVGRRGVGGDPRGVHVVRGAARATGLQAPAPRRRRRHRDRLPLPPPLPRGRGRKGEPVPPLRDEGGGPPRGGEEEEAGARGGGEADPPGAGPPVPAHALRRLRRRAPLLLRRHGVLPRRRPPLAPPPHALPPLPAPVRPVLRGGGAAGAGVPAHDGDRVPRPQAGERAHSRRRPHHAHRLRPVAGVHLLPVARVRRRQRRRGRWRRIHLRVLLPGPPVPVETPASPRRRATDDDVRGGAGGGAVVLVRGHARVRGPRGRPRRPPRRRRGLVGLRRVPLRAPPRAHPVRRRRQRVHAPQHRAPPARVPARIGLLRPRRRRGQGPYRPPPRQGPGSPPRLPPRRRRREGAPLLQRPQLRAPPGLPPARRPRLVAPAPVPVLPRGAAADDDDAGFYAAPQEADADGGRAVRPLLTRCPAAPLPAGDTPPGRDVTH